LLTFRLGFSQDIPSKEALVAHFGFTQHELAVNNEVIVYYTYGDYTKKTSKMLMYLQGSDPSPQFSYAKGDSEIKKFCWIPGDFKELSDEYLYVVVEKIGFEELIDENNIPKPVTYQKKNSLDNRVSWANAVIKHLVSGYNFEKVIVYGHSEGAPVAAKLGVVNNSITHLGFWAGNALPDFYDFVLEDSKEYYKGTLTDSVAQQRISETISGFVDGVAQNPLDTSEFGYTNLRWWSFAEPPINHLLQLDIPVYVQVASLDESAPIESTYLIPLEFARLKKNNLEYKVCVGCDHGFTLSNTNGKKTAQWKRIFNEFLQWTESTNQ